MAAIKWQICLMGKWSFNQIKNPYVLLYADEKNNMIIILLFSCSGHNNHRVYTVQSECFEMAVNKYNFSMLPTFSVFLTWWNDTHFKPFQPT